MTQEVEFQPETPKKQLEIEEFRALSPEDREKARQEGFTEGLQKHGQKFRRPPS